MPELQIDGPAPAGGRPAAPARDQNLVAPIRTYANALIGFAEMLEDPDLSLSEAKRREYREILRTSGAALEQHIRAAVARQNAT